jgi:hypothetical protein
MPGESGRDNGDEVSMRDGSSGLDGSALSARRPAVDRGDTSDMALSR